MRRFQKRPSLSAQRKLGHVDGTDTRVGSDPGEGLGPASAHCDDIGRIQRPGRAAHGADRGDEPPVEPDPAGLGGQVEVAEMDDPGRRLDRRGDGRRVQQGKDRPRDQKQDPGHEKALLRVIIGVSARIRVDCACPMPRVGDECFNGFRRMGDKAPAEITRDDDSAATGRICMGRGKRRILIRINPRSSGVPGGE